MEPADVRRLLQTNHPELAIQQLEKWGQGWDNDLFLVNKEILFRFCRREWAIPFIQTEIRVLPLLEGCFDFTIPTLIYQGLFQEKYPYCAYRYIAGEPASNCSLTAAERKTLALPIVDMLNQLHDLPPEYALEDALTDALPPDTIGRLDISKRMEQIRQKLPLTRQLFDDQPAVVNQLSAIVEELPALLEPEELQRVACLVHGDLHSRNILIRDRTRIAGLIDWGDVHLGHPAKDFSFAVSFLPPAAFHGVANRYRLFDMPLFYLSVMSALNMACHLTEYGLDQQDHALLTECRISLQHTRDNFLATR